ncbi:MAG TPA: DinB family protein [Gemmataceae bacterium]|jgi:hypothetical protein|nr:DinB family protein [Gemmataceae bacterium]
MSRLQPLIDDYLAGPTILRKAVAGMTREQLTSRPVAGKWSTLEVVCHLADFDPILADRMKQIVALDQPALKGVDENRFASALGYQDRELEEELAIISATRAQMARILRKLPDAVLERVGIHSERGPLTLERILTLNTKHIPHHVAFIGEKKKALGIG